MRLLYPGSSNTGRRLIYPFGCKVAAYVCMRDESGFHRTTWGCSLATLPRRTARRVRASFLCHPLNFSHSSNNHSKQYSHSIHTNRLAQHSSVHRRVCRVVEFLRAPGLQLSSTCKLRNVCPCRKNLFLEMSFFFWHAGRCAPLPSLQPLASSSLFTRTHLEECQADLGPCSRGIVA